MTKSEFGRIPKETVSLLKQLVADARTVASVVELGATEAVRSYTMEKCLEMLLKNWQEFEIDEAMSKEEIADLQAHVKLATTLAGGNINEKNMPVYKATLECLLEEWLDNN